MYLKLFHILSLLIGKLTVKYIKTADGFTGCYRGLVPRLCAYTVSSVVTEKIEEFFKLENSEQQTEIEEEDEDEEER